MKNNIILFKNIGLAEWTKIIHEMNYFTEQRDRFTFDEIWFVEHYPIFTQGLLKNDYSIVSSENSYINGIPLVTTNRGGRITYHGPGQQILYFLIDLKRRKINIRQFINFIHTLIIDTLNYFEIQSSIKKIPGVYVNDKKICSLGFRIKKSCTLHGLSLNVDMDLTPFNYIHPCGDMNIQMTQVKEFNSFLTSKDIRIILIKKLSQLLNIKIINKSYF